MRRQPGEYGANMRSDPGGLCLSDQGFGHAPGIRGAANCVRHRRDYPAIGGLTGRGKPWGVSSHGCE
jgi:hypothetical protein